MELDAVDPSPALARERSISSCVRFLDCRKAMRLSSAELATEGSWRTGSMDEKSESDLKACLCFQLTGNLGSD